MIASLKELRLSIWSRGRAYLLLLCSVLMLLPAIGCNGGGGTPIVGGPTPVPTPTPAPSPTPTTITVTVVNNGFPQVLAVKIGNGSFAPASLNGNLLTFTVPSGTTTYGLAWVCLLQETLGSTESIFEATVQDGTTYLLDCLGEGFAPSPTPAPTPTASASGSFDASAIAGTGEVDISGKQGGAGVVTAASGSFNFNFPTGTNDIALVASPFANPPVLAVKIVRNQTVPGAINGGNTITFDSGDLITMQPLSISNLQPGFHTPAVSVGYLTQNCFFVLAPGSSTTPTQYPVVSATEAQSGDGYSFNLATNNGTSFLTFNQNTTAAGGPFTVALPDPWLYSGPTPSATPTFTFDYSGVSGMSNVAESAGIQWSQGQPPLNTSFGISISATPLFLNGSTTMTIPDLSSLPGFLVPPSGTVAQWNAIIAGGTPPGPNSSFINVGNKGSYTVP